MTQWLQVSHKHQPIKFLRHNQTPQLYLKAQTQMIQEVPSRHYLLLHKVYHHLMRQLPHKIHKLYLVRQVLLSSSQLATHRQRLKVLKHNLQIKHSRKLLHKQVQLRQLQVQLL